MSSRNSYEKRAPSLYVSVTQSDHLLDYTIQITANHKRFPKHLRYQLSDKLVYIACEISADLRMAIQIQPNSLQSAERIVTMLEDALRNMSRYESLMILSSKWCKPGNIEYWDMIYASLQNSILNWLSVIHKRRRKLKKKESNLEENKDIVYKPMLTNVKSFEKLIPSGFDKNDPKASCFAAYSATINSKH